MSKPTSITILPDVAPHYMVDSKMHWSEFKKALRQTAMTWGFRQWFNTTVLGSAKWKEVAALGVVAKDESGAEIPDPESEGEAAADADADVEIEVEEEKISDKIMKIMGYSESEVDYFQASIRFVNVLTGVVESNKESLARQKLWNWMLKSLHGPNATPGPYHYLADEVTHTDVAALYQQLIRVIDTPTMVSQADELAAVFFHKFDPKTQDIFHYYGEVKKLVRRVHDLNAHLPQECQIILPDTIVRALLLRAMRLVPLYKTLLEQFIIKSPDQWKTFSTDDLYKHLEQVSANSRGVSQKSSSSSFENGVQANTAKVNNKNKDSVCFSFRDRGACNRKNCKFSHDSKTENSSSPSKPADSSANAPPSLCDKCGENHKTRVCKFSGKCSHCGILGHKEEVCRKKKSGVPKAMHLNADGTAVVSNLVIVQDRDVAAQANISCVDEDLTDGSVCERFIADTGANRHISPQLDSASSFQRQQISIGTAQNDKSMTSDGVGSMTLYTPEGKSFPGFSRVIFSKQAACKLASVGELCDAGMICVFSKDRLETFKAEDVRITGKPFSCDLRDPKSRLYPLVLYRKHGEKDNHSAALGVVASGGEVQWGTFPELIPDEVGQAFLAKTYIKEGLSDIDRYHAKLGDVGVKAMRKALPDLKIPDKYRCVCCIEGKIHKRNHGKCAEGERTEYEPGECIHADHSGPYVRSQGGHVYSELFLDRGSGYLWGVRMAKKSGHYEAAPRVFADARAASGRRLRYFQSDGDGVFRSKETAQLLEKLKVRHLWGAPYDSDTNPFIERGRRTVFEGTCTSLLRSGAPPSFWGEAENHKIFTINVLPSFPDPANPKVFLSRKNLLEGNKRKFNLDHLMAFGTAATCYIPVQARPDGKTPSQRRYFRGAIVGYEENTPAYRVWDFQTQMIRVVSYNFTIAHEGYYPFKDKSWLGKSSLPDLFYPTFEALQDNTQWDAFEFDEEDAKLATDQVSPHLFLLHLNLLTSLLLRLSKNRRNPQTKKSRCVDLLEFGARHLN
jgi:transposase InsO family protein